MPAAQISHPDYQKVAKASALTYAVMYQQPVVYEFDQLQVPALLVIGQEDRIIVGKGYIKNKQKLQQHGQYPVFRKENSPGHSEREIAGAAGVGHIPHIAAPQRFYETLLSFLW